MEVAGFPPARRRPRFPHMQGSLRVVVLSAALSGSFVLGCAASAFLVPPANAQQAAATQKWEYFCFPVRDADIQSKANEAGRQGWEMVAVNSSPNGSVTWCFKRPL